MDNAVGTFLCGSQVFTLPQLKTVVQREMAHLEESIALKVLIGEDLAALEIDFDLSLVENSGDEATPGYSIFGKTNNPDSSTLMNAFIKKGTWRTSKVKCAWGLLYLLIHILSIPSAQGTEEASFTHIIPKDKVGSTVAEYMPGLYVHQGKHWDSGRMSESLKFFFLKNFKSMQQMQTQLFPQSLETWCMPELRKPEWWCMDYMTPTSKHVWCFTRSEEWTVIMNSFKRGDRMVPHPLCSPETLSPFDPALPFPATSDRLGGLGNVLSTVRVGDAKSADE
ncbi:hypothetical protein BDN71DRAFT_1433985 [Pleurotus eryngii]|uniref:Uncharacterized protein n=1 Tax=Pleurotus eryngii TaxID=5323 RepID=A0A9P5ZNM0_PLEER|nr:hypothetical protein BDN71DRAFT_1433985 [Pleurotus eryngii]